VGTPEHFMFHFQHPQQCGEHPHQEMASYGPATLKKNRIQLLNITSLIQKNSGNMLTQKQNELKELVT